MAVHEATRHPETAHHPDGHGAGHDEHEHHSIPLPVYYRVFGALMVLLVITLAAAIPDLGAWNLPIAVTIAVIKAVLIVLYFMHVRWSSRLTWVFAGAAFFWLAIMFTLTLSDYYSRKWIPEPWPHAPAISAEREVRER